MKVLLLPADRSGCGYHRMTEPARALRDQCSDVEIEVSYHLDVDGEYEMGAKDTARIDSVDPHGADVVVFQRPSNFNFPGAIRLLKKMGVAVVVEIDDLLHGVSTAHSGHRDLVQDGNSRRILECARLADIVTVSTPALLAHYATHAPGRVIPNAIPRRIAELPPAFDVRSEASDVVIGWTGSVFTHPHDLQQVGTGLQTALDASHQARFTVFGQGYTAQERLGLRSPVTEIPWVPDVEEYLRMIGENFDVGLAPLRDDQFNRSKSHLKVLEYAARGVYPVRSATVEYERLGLGWRAKNAKDWAKGITRAANNQDFRVEQAAAARDQVLRHHLTEHTAELWLSAWRDARDISARSRAHLAR